MILPGDIIVRETSRGPTVWLSHRLVTSMCGISEGVAAVCRKRYKKSLPASWRRVTAGDEFFLGAKQGRSWRWGRRDGQYFYDVDTIPNRRPACYRDRLPSKAELLDVARHAASETRRDRADRQRSLLIADAEALIDNADVSFFETYRVGGRAVMSGARAQQLAEAVAWCRLIRRSLEQGRYRDYGFRTKEAFLSACASILSGLSLEGLKVTTAASLRKKVLYETPAEHHELRRALVSGKYCNDNARKIGKHAMVDMQTGEVLSLDEHQTAIMTYWLNPGGSAKHTKAAMWEQYAADMISLGIKPVSRTSFNRYTNSWASRVLSSKERHGAKYSRDTFRPYIAAKPLEWANSLWASDGSGVVPYSYTDRTGRRRVMKLYVMLVSDTASRYIAGYAVSRRGRHTEDFAMLRSAMRMALLDNGTTEVLDFISDNHGAYTSAESKAYLRNAVRNFRTIRPGESQANPAETMFRLFKRRFKAYFALPETSWNARSLESFVNPDRYDPDTLPSYDEAVSKLAAAIAEWNSTQLSNGMTPSEWFHGHKNPAAGQYDERRYRRVTGEVSRCDLSYTRGTLTLEREGRQYRFDVPTDADTIALISEHIGYSPSFRANVIWNASGADIYTTSDVWLFTCPAQRLSAKSPSEADAVSDGALSYQMAKREAFDAMLDGFVETVGYSADVMLRNYELNLRGTGTKEHYNDMREDMWQASFPLLQDRGYGQAVRPQQPDAPSSRKSRIRNVAQTQQAEKAARKASLDFQRRRISDITKYTK